MKKVQVIHNPGAGSEKHDKDQIRKWLKEAGYSCIYKSTKKDGWDDFDGDIDFLVVAGGDGTVRKVVIELLHQKLDGRWPLGLLPLGTANNIARSLGITLQPEQIIASWKEERTHPCDIGRVLGSEEAHYFLESFGYGIFPYLISEMKKLGKDNIEKRERKIKAAQKLMHHIVSSYEPRYCELRVDGSDHSGHFLLAEIMNTPTLGPNLCLSPLGDPGDGELEVILLPEQHREKFATYVEDMLNGGKETYQFHTLKGKDIKISWQGTHVHVDDKVIKLVEDQPVRIHLLKVPLQFYV